MLPWKRHPDLSALVRFSEGEAQGKESRALKAHLQDCGKCRRELDFLFSLKRAARELAHPRPPAGLLDEALARREAGERVILPTAPPPPRVKPKPIGAFVVLLGLLAGAAVFLLSGEAAAGASTLRIGPESLRVGETLEFEFRAASQLAGEEQLRVRGIHRSAGQPPPRERLGAYVEAELGRVRPGRFHGELTLPPSAVYAAFVVEDVSGIHVETHMGRPWEILDRHPSGRPTAEALEQRFRVMEKVRWEAALETAREMTALYPDRIEGWLYRYTYERLLLDRDAADSLTADHAGRLAAFERALSERADPAAGEIAALVQYARSLEDREVKDRWITRLERSLPTHPVAVQERVLSVLREHATDPARQLAALEEEWDRSGPVDELLLQHGFRSALQASDTESLLEWARRYHRYFPHRTEWVATRLVGAPATRAAGMDLLRRQLAAIEAGTLDDRPMLRSVPAHRDGVRRSKGPLLTSLGLALIADGRLDGALDTLSRAARADWHPPLHRRLGDARLAAGDTAGAARRYAFAASDPLAAPHRADSLEAALGTALEPERWAQLMREGRRELRERVRAESRRVPLGRSARVVDREGTERRLSGLVEGAPTLVLLWDRRSASGIAALARLEPERSRLAARGITILTIAREDRSPQAEAFLDRRGISVPVVFDVHDEAAAALHTWLIPAVLVLDRSGTIRYDQDQHDEFERALRHVLLLREIFATEG